jgi:hypothetical protein
MKLYIYSILFSSLVSTSLAQSIPLPEHPNPIQLRDQWINLNGQWDFTFDPTNVGLEQGWVTSGSFDKQITVPFPWGSKLSGVTDDADIGWYRKAVNIPSEWQDRRVFLIIGASDWDTQVWLDGKLLGNHQGGYVPFEFELTQYLEYGQDQTLVIRADDIRRSHTLYGKQGYGNARGIWQTVYLEARGKEYLEAVHFTTDIDQQQVEVTAYLPAPVPAEEE